MGVAWPVSLPQSPRNAGYGEQYQDNAIRETMAVGPFKSRRRSSIDVVDVSLSFVMTDAQLATFQTFFEDTLFAGTVAVDLPLASGTQECLITSPPAYARTEQYWAVSFSAQFTRA
ncbi:MAG: hypothetical protein AAFX44_06675 [Pseudomonadota bacterium]